jgi:hypothetical protein
MGLLKILLWIFVISIIAYAIYMTYVDISKHIPQEKRKKIRKKFQRTSQLNMSLIPISVDIVNLT